MRRILVPAVAACLLLAPAAVHAANPNPKPKPPKAKVTLAAAPDPITFGRVTTLSGRLTGGRHANGKTIVVEADTFPIDGQYAKVAAATTDANGDWSVTQRPTALTRYRATAKTSPPVTSATADVRVRLHVTIHVSDRTPSRGARVRFHGTAAPAHDGATVRIQRRTATGSWHTVRRTVLRDAGTSVSRYSRRVRVRRSGTYRVRVLPGDADHLRGTSHRKRLRVS